MSNAAPMESYNCCVVSKSPTYAPTKLSARMSGFTRNSAIQLTSSIADPCASATVKTSLCDADGSCFFAFACAAAMAPLNLWSDKRSRKNEDNLQDRAEDNNSRRTR